MGMDNLTKLREDLETKAAEEAAMNAENFNAEKDSTLTPEEEESIKKMKGEMGKDPVVMLTDTDDDGRKVQSPAEEYAKSLDERTIALVGPQHAEALKTINSGDIVQSIDSIREDTKKRALHMFRTMSVGDGANTEMSDDDYIAVNDAAIAAIHKYLGVSRTTADFAVNALRKVPMKQILEILPKQFLDIYLTPAEQKIASVQNKDRLLTVIAYLMTTGPELDYLNEYIDEENKLVVVSKRLMQCQVDFAEMLKDEAKLSELVAQSREIVPLDESFWAKHIQLPNRVHNEFAQRVVIFQQYEQAYRKILEDYPECDENARARLAIFNEIQECQDKQIIYRNVCELETMRELWNILTERLKVNKKTSMQSLTYEANEAIEKVRRCKQNLPFPGYKGDERKAEQIMANYIAAFVKMLNGYNANILAIHEKNTEQEDERGVEAIHIDGYDDTEVMTVYAILLVILMGRILKKYNKNDRTKYDAIALDAYFQLFCKIGTDVYLMRDVWNLCKDFVKYTMDTWFIPGKVAVKKGKK